MKRVLFPIFTGVVLSCLLISCGTPAQTEIPPDTVTPQQQEELPTSTPLPPTDTSTPEPTATISLTATPESQIFRDDFDGSLQPGWIWDEEDPERWTFVDVNGKQWLQLTGNSGRSNVLMRDVPTGDFAIVAHIKADPRLNFHQASIFIFQDTSNYVAVNTGYCQPCSVGGYGYFMETAASGGDVLGHFYEAPRAAEDTDVYLKIDIVDDVISGYYATTPDEWTRIGRFGNFFELNSIGLSATNSSPPSGTPEDIIAQFDFFEVTTP
jgi:hypothetical protein